MNKVLTLLKILIRHLENTLKVNCEIILPQLTCEKNKFYYLTSHLPHDRLSYTFKMGDADMTNHVHACLLTHCH